MFMTFDLAWGMRDMGYCSLKKEFLMCSQNPLQLCNEFYKEKWVEIWIKESMKINKILNLLSSMTEINEE